MDQHLRKDNVLFVYIEATVEENFIKTKGVCRPGEKPRHQSRKSNHFGDKPC